MVASFGWVLGPRGWLPVELGGPVAAVVGLPRFWLGQPGRFGGPTWAVGHATHLAGCGQTHPYLSVLLVGVGLVVAPGWLGAALGRRATHGTAHGRRTGRTGQRTIGARDRTGQRTIGAWSLGAVHG